QTASPLERPNRCSSSQKFKTDHVARTASRKIFHQPNHSQRECPCPNRQTKLRHEPALAFRTPHSALRTWSFRVPTSAFTTSSPSHRSIVHAPSAAAPHPRLRRSPPTPPPPPPASSRPSAPP